MRHSTPSRTGYLGVLSQILSLFLFIFVAAPSLAQDGPPVDWSGTWETHWRDGGARVIIEEDGGTVSGLYPVFGGRIEATATGRVLSGRWVQEDREGDFEFVQSQDGQSFAGRFGSGEWWTGARAATVLVDGAPVDQSSPMATMRSFLTAANQAADGNLDVLGRATSLVLSPDGSDDPTARFEHARALHEVIDLTSFRIWDLPHAAPDGGGEVVFELEQAGTAQTVTFPFQRVDGDWFILPLAIDRLAETADRMRAGRAIPARRHARFSSGLRLPTRRNRGPDAGHSGSARSARDNAGP